jgi:hypothetical protein
LVGHVLLLAKCLQVNNLKVLVRKKSDNVRIVIIEMFHLVVFFTKKTISTSKLVLGHAG